MNMLILLIGVALLAGTSAESCSSGDTDYMCRNLDRCWSELGFTAKGQLQQLCVMQGKVYPVEITVPPKNVTVKEGAAASFKCSADFAISVNIQKTSEMINRRLKEGDEDVSSPSTQTTIQEIDAAQYTHEGWYTCTAVGEGGTRVTAQAYLEIRDICATATCESPRVCQADIYTATYECVCPGDCDGEAFDPVCGSDCNSYFNECTMNKETCENDLVGVTVYRKGLCTFQPSGARLTETPSDQTLKRGAKINFGATAEGQLTPDITYHFNGKVVDVKNLRMKPSYAGLWTVKASNCAGRFESTDTFRLTLDQDQNLVEPNDQCCKVYGDPHVITFDGKMYDYMGIGTFVIAQDNNEGIWVVYGTMEACGDDKSKQLSCITSITVFYENQMVQFLRMWRINSGGEEFMIPLGSARNIGGINVVNKDLQYIITLGNLGVEIRWDGIITAEVCVSKCVGGTAGLCANANCDADDEFLGRGFKNPYTNSWEAKTSSEFGNSWVVDRDGAILEPEDGNLPLSRSRPCAVIPIAEKTVIEARCNAVMDLSDFALIADTDLDKQTLLNNCYFDGCAGLMFGAGCEENGDGTCTAYIEELIELAIKGGMSREEAISMYMKGLDSACLMGIFIGRELRRWGYDTGSGWRSLVYPVCPSDDEIRIMKICPT